MIHPPTLLQLAGAQPGIARWSHAVLVLIDAQLEYVSGRVPLTGIEAAIGECARLLDLARAAQAPVIHVVHHGRPGGALFDPDGPSAAIVPELQTRAGEGIVVKTLPNSFAGTDLDRLIRATGRSELVLAGFMTHMCVSTTTRAALDHGYATTVVASACATRDLPAVSGGVIAAAVVHETALAELADRFATVVPSPDVWLAAGEVGR